MRLVAFCTFSIAIDKIRPCIWSRLVGLDASTDSAHFVYVTCNWLQAAARRWRHWRRVAMVADGVEVTVGDSVTDKNTTGLTYVATAATYLSRQFAVVTSPVCHMATREVVSWRANIKSSNTAAMWGQMSQRHFWFKFKAAIISPYT